MGRGGDGGEQPGQAGAGAQDAEADGVEAEQLVGIKPLFADRREPQGGVGGEEAAHDVGGDHEAADVGDGAERQ